MSKKPNPLAEILERFLDESMGSKERWLSEVADNILSKFGAYEGPALVAKAVALNLRYAKKHPDEYSKLCPFLISKSEEIAAVLERHYQEIRDLYDKHNVEHKAWHAAKESEKAAECKPATEATGPSVETDPFLGK